MVSLALKNLLAVCLCAVSSYALADAMPEGSRQAILTQMLAEKTQMSLQENCPPATNTEGAQVACGHFEGHELLNFMTQLDAVVYTLSTYPATLPDLSGFELTARTNYWIYLPEFGRFERSFDFEGGSYRVIYVPFETLSSNVAVIYTPPNIQTHLTQ